MKAKHHFWSSLAAGGALYFVTSSEAAIAGAMIGGFLIDADHILDQLWSIYRGAPHSRKLPADEASRRLQEGGAQAWFLRYARRRKLVRLPLVFHSGELLIALSIVTALIPLPFLIGLITGQALHLLLDFIRHRHEFRSPFFYLLSYRLFHGFRRDRLVKPEYL